ncbi:hypothetical protein B0H17DRAFT_1150044 [Mycena rosella]|uniref:Uncharacterized protein n=1 Tax=Mycena rosella TaxID=1033263 RepID=A0AAD7FPY7_MYCRO|nr:hypothetical protein B0H17DRAFT_1150044 [Mycena rosella]
MPLFMTDSVNSMKPRGLTLIVRTSPDTGGASCMNCLLGWKPHLHIVFHHLEFRFGDSDHFTAQDIPSIETIQSQTPQFADFPTHLGLDVDILAAPSRDFAPYPTHLGLEVDLPADRSFGTASDYLWADTAFDSVSIPSSSSSTTFSFPPPYSPHPAYLPYNFETIQNASDGSFHPFNIPTIPPAQMNADPQHIPASDLIARTARKRKAESQMSERANKNMRLEFIDGGF